MSKKEFNLSDKIEGDVCWKEDVKELIKRGQAIFFADYRNAKISKKEFNYALEKWQEFLKLAGKEFLERINTDGEVESETSDDTKGQEYDTREMFIKEDDIIRG